MQCKSTYVQRTPILTLYTMMCYKSLQHPTPTPSDTHLTIVVDMEGDKGADR